VGEWEDITFLGFHCESWRSSVLGCGWLGGGYITKSNHPFIFKVKTSFRNEKQRNLTPSPWRKTDCLLWWSIVPKKRIFSNSCTCRETGSCQNEVTKVKTRCFSFFTVQSRRKREFTHYRYFLSRVDFFSRKLTTVLAKHCRTWINSKLEDDWTATHESFVGKNRSINKKNRSNSIHFPKIFILPAYQRRNMLREKTKEKEMHYVSNKKKYKTVNGSVAANLDAAVLSSFWYRHKLETALVLASSEVSTSLIVPMRHVPVVIKIAEISLASLCSCMKLNYSKCSRKTPILLRVRPTRILTAHKYGC